MRPLSSPALNEDGVNAVSVISGGLLKNPDGCGVVPQAAMPVKRVVMTTGLHTPPTGVEATSLITSAFGVGETGGLSSSKFCHTESDASAFARMRQLQQ